MDAPGLMGAGDIAVDQSRCLNARNRSSNCRQCQRVCPGGAVRVTDDGISLDEAACIGCGLCIAVCPMEVFTSPLWSERGTVEAVQSVVEPTVELVCPRSFAKSGPTPGAVKTDVCLGAYSSGALFEMALGHDLMLHADSCGACRCDEGLTVMQVSARLAGRWAEAATHRPRISCALEDEAPFSLGGNAVVLAPTASDVTDVGSDFQVGFARHGSLLFSAMLEDEWSQPKERRPIRSRLTEQHVPTWRRHLKGVWRADRRTRGVRALWPALHVDRSACVACGTCRQYCPTGAIDQRIEQGSLTTLYTPGLCADCGLCAMACVGSAITRLYGETDVPFEEHVVFNEAVSECISCHSPALVRGGAACYWCTNEPRMDELMKQVKHMLLGQGGGFST